MIRGKLRGVNPLHLDMDAACALAGILPPRHAVQVARLRYLRRLTQHCPTALWNLLQADADVPGSWIADCQSAFNWFRKHYDVPFAPATNDFQTWITLIAIDTSWKGRLKRAAHSCQQYCAAIAEQQVFQLRFNERFIAAGGTLPVASQPQQDKWKCDLCDRCFSSLWTGVSITGVLMGLKCTFKIIQFNVVSFKNLWLINVVYSCGLG